MLWLEFCLQYFPIQGNKRKPSVWRMITEYMGGLPRALYVRYTLLATSPSPETIVLQIFCPGSYQAAFSSPFPGAYGPSGISSSLKTVSYILVMQHQVISIRVQVTAQHLTFYFYSGNGADQLGCSWWTLNQVCKVQLMRLIAISETTNHSDTLTNKGSDNAKLQLSEETGKFFIWN